MFFNLFCRWFTYFYAWGVVWNILFFCNFWLICIGHSSSKIPFINAAVTALTGIDLKEICLEGMTQRQFDVLIVLLLVCIQVSRRLYECLFVSVFSATGKMHVIHLLLGLFFYTSLGPTALMHLKPGEGQISGARNFISIHDS